MSDMGKFTPFIEPSMDGGKQLVQAVGADYICTGCGDVIPGGAWLFEVIKDGMVVGITARNGSPTAPIIHTCGQVAT